MARSPPDATPLIEAAAGAPRADREVAIADPDIAALYERKLVLVRPDGHVAWRGDACPADAAAIIDRVRGATPPESGMTAKRPAVDTVA